jgi:hypothetical protein
MHNTNWRGSLGQLGSEGTTSGRETLINIGVPRPLISASMFTVDVACKKTKMEVSSCEIRA